MRFVASRPAQTISDIGCCSEPPLPPGALLWRPGLTSTLEFSRLADAHLYQCSGLVWRV